jgi:hypothetical protein
LTIPVTKYGLGNILGDQWRKLGDYKKTSDHPVMRSGFGKHYAKNRTAYLGWPSGTEERNPRDRFYETVLARIKMPQCKFINIGFRGLFVP